MKATAWPALVAAAVLLLVVDCELSIARVVGAWNGSLVPELWPPVRPGPLGVCGF
jgi:hypothetical protein